MATKFKSKFQARKVNRLTGTNPIAQAVARGIVTRAVLDTRIALHVAEDGAECKQLLTEMNTLFSILHNAVVNGGAVDPASYAPYMVQAMNAMLVMGGKWDKSYLPIFDDALSQAEEVNRLLPPAIINQAVKNISGGVLT